MAAEISEESIRPGVRCTTLLPHSSIPVTVTVHLTFEHEGRRYAVVRSPGVNEDHFYVRLFEHLNPS